MMRKFDYIYVEDILERIENIGQSIEFVTFDKLLENREKSDSLIRQIEIIGEAASKISSEFKTKYPATNIPEAIAMRNVLIHDYGMVSIEEVWSTVVNDIKELVIPLAEVLQELNVIDSSQLEYYSNLYRWFDSGEFATQNRPLK